ncbi:protein PGR-like, partial [Dendrobium catenatum]|uniref:protein PGR-like n=1 Tax=Dendrobium catenatum TaxID=906689 RepID=UPI00109F0E90
TLIIYILHDQKVRKGTNGAVSVEGLLAAAAAGLVIGSTFVMVGWLSVSCGTHVVRRELLAVPIAAIAGLCGSLIDSILGATLQFSGFCTLRKKVVGRKTPTVIRISGMEVLDNNAVNAVSVLITTLLTGLACIYIF